MQNILKKISMIYDHGVNFCEVPLKVLQKSGIIEHPNSGGIVLAMANWERARLELNESQFYIFVAPWSAFV